MDPTAISSRSIKGLSYQQIMKLTNELAVEQCQQHEVEAIGLSFAGNVDSDNGTVAYRQVFDKDTHPSKWKYETFRIVEELHNATSVPVVIENDGNSALIAEWKYGSAKGHNNVVCLVFGTYAGSGVLSQGKILHRRTSGPLLPGSITQYKKGFDYLGVLTSGTGFLRESEKVYGRQISGKELFSMVEAGDKQARLIFEEAGKWLGVMVTNAINIFDPEVVCLNGPVMHAADYLLPAMEKIVSEYSMPSIGSPTKVTVGKFIDDAGLIGAASIALDSLL